MKKYRKHITITYEHINSEEGDKALDEVYDMIFAKILEKRRLLQGKQSKLLTLSNT